MKAPTTSLVLPIAEMTRRAGRLRSHVPPRPDRNCSASVLVTWQCTCTPRRAPVSKSAAPRRAGPGRAVRRAIPPQGALSLGPCEGLASVR